ncbi:hypothetical protein CQ020_06300 [Arthrobacter sp. MYb23]|nr:hypothetical protein CQ038_08925 [Arthrobacter sp. MYb51]PRB98053.1 hypothetical protein CQ020_06300 [Arthrobacter sp. MYb23]
MNSASRLIAALENAGFPVASHDFTKLRGVVSYDPLNVTIDVRSIGIDGAEVRERLALEHGILTDLATSSTVVALLPPGTDLQESDLVEALTAIRRGGNAGSRSGIPPLAGTGALKLTPRDAYFAQAVVVDDRRVYPRRPRCGHRELQGCT